MFQPTEFRDGKNIIIIDNIPRFRYTGSSYRDKLKNGLSLDYLFQLEDMIPIQDQEVVKEVKSNESEENFKYVDYEENYVFYEDKEFKILGLSRKGKWIPLKKRQSRNLKKNMVKTNGYEDKLFTLEQELPELFESQIVIDYDDDYCSYCGCSICNVW